jgi:hypothetical protein
MMSVRLPTMAACCALAIAVVTPASASAASAALQLPDLEQEAPSGLVLSNGALGGHPGRYYLGFRSAVRNVGSGPLVIRGHRASRRTPTMAATQIIQGEGGALSRVRGVGRMRYVVSPSHRHWHLLTFDRYVLRRVGGRRVKRRDRKTGFCLGDRYRALPPFAGPSPAEPGFTSNCGLLQPGRLSVTEGISVGYGDDYAANLEGQLIGLTGLPGGRYVLTHQVNPARRLRELRYDNNAASLLLSVHWVRGVPSVRVLASCDHSADCPAPAASRRKLAGAPVAVEAAQPFYCPLASTRPTAG